MYLIDACFMVHSLNYFVKKLVQFKKKENDSGGATGVKISHLPHILTPNLPQILTPKFFILDAHEQIYKFCRAWELHLWQLSCVII